MSSTPLRIVLPIAVALLAPLARAAEAPKAAPKGPPIVLVATADLGAASDAIEKATGVKGEKLPFGSIPLTDGRSFEIDSSVAERLLQGSHDPLLKGGLFLFRYERSFGMAGEKDKLGLLKTADYRVVIRRVGTGQPARNVTNQKIVDWLEALSKDEPFQITEVGTDYLAGRFDRVPADPTAVAKRCAELAPDLVAGRASTLDLLAAEIRTNRTLYLIW